MVIGFYEEDAPRHVERFKELAREGFYDGILWHRVVPAFAIQAGDPMTKDPHTPRAEYGKHGSGQMLNAEFNEREHHRGAVGMARHTDASEQRETFYDTADSQFYIVLEDQPHLDRKYTVFGHLLDGYPVADSIAAVETDIHGVPIRPVPIDSIRIKARSEVEIP
ncbi:peptidylprolyl isomerase [bacterium]|nr:peptidylprolyl isomerase [bacterium]